MNYLRAKKVLISLFLMAFVQNTFCQPDGNYIRYFEKELSVNTFFGRKLAMFDYYLKDNDDDRYTYVPNNSSNVGAGFSWKGFAFDAGFGLPFLKNESVGDTKSSDFQFYYYAKKFLAGFFWQDYNGFYAEEGEHDRPDIKMIRSGIFGEYIFNSEKLSYKAAFSQSEQQLQSAGSFLLGAGVYYTRLEADFAFDDVKKNNVEKQKVEIWQFGPSVGYGYTWVPKEKYSINGSLSLGVNVSLNTINGEKLDANIFPSASPKISMGYNNESWGVNLIFLMNIAFVPDNDEKNFTFGSGNFTLNYVRRFSLKSNENKNEKK